MIMVSKRLRTLHRCCCCSNVVTSFQRSLCCSWAHMNLILLMWYARVTLCIVYVHPREVVSNSFVLQQYISRSHLVQICVQSVFQCLIPSYILYIHGNFNSLYSEIVEYLRNCWGTIHHNNVMAERFAMFKASIG